MSHVYATLDALKRRVVEGGSKYGTDSDTNLMVVLGATSRSIDTWTRRTSHRHGVPSGFGPLLATHYFDGPGGSHLELGDDLLSITGTISVLDAIGATAIAYTDETDFYKGPYGGPRYRWLDLHGDGYVTWYGTRRGVSITGKWGYQDSRLTSASTTTEALDTTEIGVDVTAGTDFSPGQTILIDSEQMYVKSIATNTLTVTRNVNGTTAATHLTAAAIDVYQYPDDVVEACLQASLRRWRGRDAGGYGNEFTGIGGTRMLSDTPIFRSLLVDYRLVRV